MKIKVLVVISDIHKALEHELFCDLIDRTRFEVAFYQINSRGTTMDEYIINSGFRTYYRNVKTKIDFPGAILNLFRIIRKDKYDVVHTHLFTGTIIGLLAARAAGVKVRIHTRHHADYHHKYFPSAVKYDRMNNALSTSIVAISRNIESILIDDEGASPEKVSLVYHGFTIDEFQKSCVGGDRIRTLQDKYEIPEDSFVVGVISRYTEWKGVHYIIDAFTEFHRMYPHAILVLANAGGDYEGVIKSKLSILPEGSYREIRFELDSKALFNMFDIFVHVPIDEKSEAFGQVYIEALAAGTPSVFTLSGIAAEFVEHDKNAIVVPFKDEDAILNAMNRLFESPDLRVQLSKAGYESVKHQFDIQQKISKLEKLYSAAYGA